MEKYGIFALKPLTLNHVYVLLPKSVLDSFVYLDRPLDVVFFFRGDSNHFS